MVRHRERERERIAGGGWRRLSPLVVAVAAPSKPPTYTHTHSGHADQTTPNIARREKLCVRHKK